MSPALAKALKAQVEVADLEGQTREWSAEQRLLVFPNPAGRPHDYGSFHKRVWRPTLAKAGVVFRRYHATRHSFATWLLEHKTDIRYVQAQLGHSSIVMTVDTYGHVQEHAHEHHVDALDELLGR